MSSAQPLLLAREVCYLLLEQLCKAMGIEWLNSQVSIILFSFNFILAMHVLIRGGRTRHHVEETNSTELQ